MGGQPADAVRFQALALNEDKRHRRPENKDRQHIKQGIIFHKRRGRVSKGRFVCFGARHSQRRWRFTYSLYCSPKSSAISFSSHGIKTNLSRINRSEERRVGKECRSRW